MKRLASLATLVLALAIVPVALADDGGSTTGTTPAPAAAAPAGTARAPLARLRLDVLRLRLDLVRLRHRLACRKSDSDRCTQFTQKVVDRLTTLDGKLESKLGELQCSSDSTDKKCTMLTKFDDRLHQALDRLNSREATDAGAPTP